MQNQWFYVKIDFFFWFSLDFWDTTCRNELNRPSLFSLRFSWDFQIRFFSVVKIQSKILTKKSCPQIFRRLSIHFVISFLKNLLKIFFKIFLIPHFTKKNFFREKPHLPHLTPSHPSVYAVSRKWGVFKRGHLEVTLYNWKLKIENLFFSWFSFRFLSRFLSR